MNPTKVKTKVFFFLYFTFMKGLMQGQRLKERGAFRNLPSRKDGGLSVK